MHERGAAAGGVTAEPAASVVVPAYDAAASIRRALGSLAAQRTAEPFEVILVWSGEDATPEIARREFPWVRRIGRTGRIPTGAARNLGIAAAAGRVVAFLAADCTADPDWLGRRIAAHREGFACVGGAIRPADPVNAWAEASHLLEYSAGLPSRPREVVSEPIYQLSFDREIFDRFGLYDPQLVRGEDTQLNWRLARAGIPFLFDPAIVIAHPGPTTAGEFWRHQEDHGRWFGWLARRVEVPGVEGRGVLRHLRLVALYPAVRVVRLLRRVAAWDRSRLGRVLRLQPRILFGVAAATWGLVRGLSGPLPEGVPDGGEGAPPEGPEG